MASLDGGCDGNAGSHVLKVVLVMMVTYAEGNEDMLVTLSEIMRKGELMVILVMW